ncbi:MAG: hypothetical protein H0T51_15830, partial [Pirellulales bacterium]|nr:hypothetical protein [Pirellulales bacterium]
MASHWRSFSYIGLAIATLFFAASLTPSLLPRHFAVQGILSGFALAAGYGIGVFFVWLWNYLELRHPSDRTQRVSKSITTVVVALVAALFLWRASIWQNSIRTLMEMDAVETAYPWRVGLIALVQPRHCRHPRQCRPKAAKNRLVGVAAPKRGEWHALG